MVLLAVKRKCANSPLSYCLSAFSFLSPDSQNDDDRDYDDGGPLLPDLCREIVMFDKNNRGDDDGGYFVMMNH